MKILWNRIFYSIYLFENNLTTIIRKILSFVFWPLFHLPFIRNGLEKKGSSIKQIKDVTVEVLNNPKNGKGISIARLHMDGLLIIIQYGLFNFLQIILRRSLIQYVWENKFYAFIFLIGLATISGIINWHLLRKQNIYLIYFKRFQNESPVDRKKWNWISFGCILTMITFLVLSFVILVNTKLAE